MRTLFVAGLLLCLTAPLLRAADWPQWRGPERTGISKEKGLLQRWPAGGPRLVWTFREAGSGYSTPAVVGGHVYCMGARDEVEYVYALDRKGKEQWTTKIGPVYDFEGNSWSRGPNATPTVEGELLYALGSQGELLCVSVADGKEKWRKNLPKELAAEVNPIQGGDPKMGWGFSWSPLVDGDQLVCTTGGPKGLFAALDKKTGKVLWRSEEVKTQCTYSSPIAATIDGKRQYITLTQEGVVGVSAKDGSLLWSYKREEPYPDVVCPTPICSDNLVYASAWGGGAVLLKLTAEGNKFKAEEVYSKKEIGNRHSGVLLVDGNVFGYHEERSWVCQAFATGKVKWISKRNALKQGGLIYANGLLYCVAEKSGRGVVALLEPSAKGYKEVSLFPLSARSKLRKDRGGVWTHPVVSDGLLFVRDQELLFCYDVKAR
jgi:outer membrane protein assembly factor BamB